ncbi:MAG: heavy metal translocating P-type ATPase [Patescibacteria group bacterium]|nr:heavy metal translocating P-type ATPase [Patescibacteria group bacterium]
MECCHEHKEDKEKYKSGAASAGAGGRYTCPMHPEVVKERPGMCPECGMNLLAQKTEDSEQKTGKHDKHAGHKTASFLQKFWIALVLSIPLFLYSPVFEALVGSTLPKFPGFPYLQILLGSVIFFYCGAIFLTSAWREMKARSPGMMTLIALAITTAYVWSVASVLLGRADTLFWELGSLIAIMLLGHWLEMRAVKGARGALKELAKLLPDEAEVERGGSTVIIPLQEIKEGDIVRVKPGARIPADGRVVEGESDVNESLVTGESKPVGKKKNDEVIAGTVNGDGSLRVAVLHVGEKTFLAGVARLVEEAQASKSRLQLLSDRAAFYLTIVAVVVGTATFGSWFMLGMGIAFATERLVAVLVIACPHALGLAVPLVASISTTKAAQNGLLIKQRSALEAARDIDTVLFDKTGTLTKGEFGVSAILPAPGRSEEDVLRVAASLNADSEHPLAHAMVEEWKRRGSTLSNVRDFARVPGKGARGIVDGKRVAIGNDALLAEENVKMPEEGARRVAELAREGKTVVHLTIDGSFAGSIALADIIREESRAAISALHDVGITTAMITGDSEEVAQWVARELGIDEHFARVLPGQKSERVKALQMKGNKVAFVGDGVNDAPALAQADLGIAIGAGTNVAIESAGIILVKSDPRDIPKIISLSRMTYRKMIQNLWWAAGYNIVAIPLAAGVLAYQGIVLQPAVAAVLMSVSTVIVAWNAMLLRKKTL